MPWPSVVLLVSLYILTFCSSSGYIYIQAFCSSSGYLYIQAFCSSSGYLSTFRPSAVLPVISLHSGLLQFFRLFLYIRAFCSSSGCLYIRAFCSSSGCLYIRAFCSSSGYLSIFRPSAVLPVISLIQAFCSSSGCLYIRAFCSSSGYLSNSGLLQLFRCHIRAVHCRFRIPVSVTVCTETFVYKLSHALSVVS
jgi:hypothetical protein